MTKTGNTAIAQEMNSAIERLEKAVRDLEWGVEKLNRLRGTYKADDEYQEIAEALGVEDHENAMKDAESIYLAAKWAVEAIDGDGDKVNSIKNLFVDVQRP